MGSKPACRIYVVKSPVSPVAAVFRRGPSKQVQVLKWDMATDTFTPGQWFKGRIYERRCDVSPDGRYLMYFAAKWKPPHYSWTAVSKLPYLTALALWPKGNGWGGGGLFESTQSIQLNHRSNEMSLADGFDLPGALKIGPFGGASGWGEDEPICRTRMQREGWEVAQEAVVTYSGVSLEEWREQLENDLAILQEFQGNLVNMPPLSKPLKPTSPYADVGPMFAVYNPPEILRKSAGKFVLEMTTYGFHETNGPTYVIKFRVLDADSRCLLDLGRADWAEWAEEGDLLFARSGGIYRIDECDLSIDNAALLIDLNNSTFTSIAAPVEYRSW